MSISISLDKAHAHRAYGDLVAIWSWLNEERALFLVPRYRRGAPWFVVYERAAHEWDDRSPQTVFDVMRRAVIACEALGFTPTPQNARRIVSIVNNAIPELIRMPHAPEPELLPGDFGQLVLRANGEEIAREQIRLPRDEGAVYG